MLSSVLWVPSTFTKRKIKKKKPGSYPDMDVGWSIGTTATRSSWSSYPRFKPNQQVPGIRLRRTR